jgi:hypothetical protein
MAGIRESVAKQVLVYTVDPQTLAEVCQNVLKKTGKVKQVSRETGVISGGIRPSTWSGLATIILNLSKKGESTELSIQTNYGEGIITSNGAQKAMMKFIGALGKDERLHGKSAGGW